MIQPWLRIDTNQFTLDSKGALALNICPRKDFNIIRDVLTLVAAPSFLLPVAAAVAVETSCVPGPWVSGACRGASACWHCRTVRASGSPSSSCRPWACSGRVAHRASTKTQLYINVYHIFIHYLSRFGDIYLLHEVYFKHGHVYFFHSTHPEEIHNTQTGRTRTVPERGLNPSHAALVGCSRSAVVRIFPKWSKKGSGVRLIYVFLFELFFTSNYLLGKMYCFDYNICF